MTLARLAGRQRAGGLVEHCIEAMDQITAEESAAGDVAWRVTVQPPAAESEAQIEQTQARGVVDRDPQLPSVGTVPPIDAPDLRQGLVDEIQIAKGDSRRPMLTSHFDRQSSRWEFYDTGRGSPGLR